MAIILAVLFGSFYFFTMFDRLNFPNVPVIFMTSIQYVAFVWAVCALVERFL